ncbi:hypothetical protein ACNO7T_13030 [Vibrio campbellii]
MNSEVKENKTQNSKLLSLGSIIFLGALGSGLWDLFLKDLFNKGLRFVISIADYLFSGFADSLYSSVGKGVVPLLDILFTIFMILAIIVTPWFLTYLVCSGRSKVQVTRREKPNRDIHKFRIVYYIVMSSTITMVYGHTLISGLNNFKTSIYTEQVLEIIRPYVEQSDYYQLRSQYRLISTRQGFQDLYFKINEIAYHSSLTLPKFEPLLIDELPDYNE